MLSRTLQDIGGDVKDPYGVAGASTIRSGWSDFALSLAQGAATIGLTKLNTTLNGPQTNAPGIKPFFYQPDPSLPPVIPSNPLPEFTPPITQSTANKTGVVLFGLGLLVAFAAVVVRARG